MSVTICAGQADMASASGFSPQRGSQVEHAGDQNAVGQVIQRENTGRDGMPAHVSMPDDMMAWVQAPMEARSGKMPKNKGRAESSPAPRPSAGGWAAPARRPKWSAAAQGSAHPNMCQCVHGSFVACRLCETTSLHLRSAGRHRRAGRCRASFRQSVIGLAQTGNAQFAARIEPVNIGAESVFIRADGIGKSSTMPL